ncbi:RDD family protein [Sulfurimonas sp. HSL-1716]|uniref:RDD family protein n=1 Tax=Hydrocurvibacter sulfurireducens TaxID=3131937 RepID=UPI0031F88297
MRWRKLKQKKINKSFDAKQRVVYPKYTDKIKGFITDLFMIYTPILYIITYVVLNGKEAFQASALAQFSGVTLYGIIYAVFIARTGQTPGKKAYDMKVVDAKTLHNISFLRAFWRFAAFLFTATTLLGLLLPFYRKDKRALHDILSSTVEVENRS